MASTSAPPLTATPVSAPPGHTPTKRIPTDSSYYSFNGVQADKDDPNSQTWMYAREARQQQAGVPWGRHAPYPSNFLNKDKVPLSTPGWSARPGGRKVWLHHPLVPGKSSTWSAAAGDSPGPVRSVYTHPNRANFDVMHHDPAAGLTPGGTEKFALSRYHAAVARPPPPPAPSAVPGPVSGPGPSRVGTI